jgi:hypothetical protein
MSREVRRVPLDFEWPIGEVWGGYIRPDALDGKPCPDCKTGYSPRGQELYELWYGYRPFRPEDTGSERLWQSTPAVREYAKRNVSRAPEYYGVGQGAIIRESERLARLWNAQWCHHLEQADVDALVAEGRLMDFTSTWSKEAGWRKIEPPPTVTAAMVNTWSLAGMGHNSINAGIVIRAKCEREGVSVSCATCDGHGEIEVYPGQREQAEAWEWTQPPTGEGWQLWETTSEGSPSSPVFTSSEELAAWLTTPEGGDAVGFGRTRARWTIEQARAFVSAGYSLGSMIFTPEKGLQDGATAMVDMVMAEKGESDADQ